MSKNKLRILMVGGRRCGKSTTLAAMWKNSSAVLRDTNLTLAPNNVRLFNDFSQKTDDIINTYFDEFDPFDVVQISTAGSSGDSKYEFSLSLNGESEKLLLEFIDVPGEWYEPDHGTADLDEAKRRAGLLEEYIKTSDVYIIAIDTPCLMEELNPCGFGKYHIDANKPLEITEYLKSINVENFKTKNFIFVPLKCERYYNQHKMENVVDCIKKGYSELLDFLASPNLKNVCTVTVKPIISLGGIEFQEFNGPLEAPDISANYIYSNGIDSKYSPMYCEQPLIAAIEFLITKSMDPKAKSGPIWHRLFEMLKEIIFKSVSGAEFDLSKEFTAEIKKLHGKRIDDSSIGYVTLQKGGMGV